MTPDPDNAAPPLKSPFDPEETAEEDLWFLLGEPEDRAPTVMPTDMPLPMAIRAR